jgi:hypothetical protein
MKYVAWTNKQILRLRECWPTMPREDLLIEFAPHSWYSIKGTARRLGILRRGKARDWKAICKAHVMQTGMFEVPQ